MSFPNAAPRSRASALLRRHPTLLGTILVVAVFALATPLAVWHLRHERGDAAAPPVSADVAVAADRAPPAPEVVPVEVLATLEALARAVRSADTAAVARLYPAAPAHFLDGFGAVRARLGPGGTLALGRARPVGAGGDRLDVEFVLRAEGTAAPAEMPFVARLVRSGDVWRIETLRRLGS